MTPEEAKKFLENEKAQGATDNEILATLYEMFKADDIDIEELGELVSFIGYELTDEFKNMSPEDQKTKGWNYEDDEEEGEEKPEAETKEEPKAEEETEAKEEEQPKVEEKDNEEEKAKQLFGLNK